MSAGSVGAQPSRDTPAQPGGRGVPGVALLILANLLWSGNYISGRVLAAAMPALLLNGVRWTVSAVLLLALVRASGGSVPFRREWPRLLLLGVLGMFLFSSLTYLGLHAIGAARAGLISGTIPVMILLAGSAVGVGRASGRAWAGVALSVAGVALLFAGRSTAGSSQGSLGELEVLLAAVAWGFYTALGRRLALRIPPLPMTAGAAALGALPSLAAGWWSLRTQPVRMDAEAWTALVYVSTAASVVAYWSWTAGVAAVGTARAAPFVNLLPVFTALAGVALLGERLTWQAAAGGSVVLVGAWLSQSARSARAGP